MKKYFFTLVVGMVLSLTADGFVFASNLPACPKDESAIWNDCFGSFHKDDGEKYVGEFKNDMRHGYGTVSFVAPHANAGNKYVGEFYNGKANGSGTYFVSNGDKYVGEWKDSQRDGHGTYNFSNGDEYVGEWKAHQMHGEGIYTYADGDVEEGVWKNNEFQYAKKLKQKASQKTSSSTSDKEISELFLSCRTSQGTVTYGDFKMRTLPETEIFITIRVFQLDSPFKTGGVGDFSVTQRAMISVEGPVFFDTGEMHSFVKNMGGEQLTLINNESFSFTNSSSKFKPGKWNISVSRTTGFLQVIGLDTSTNVQMVSYEGKCKKAVKKKLF